jgi:hypothetical protein
MTPPPRPPQPGIFRERNSTFSQQEEVEHTRVLHARVMQPLLQQLHSDSVVWDIGAGIGTVSLHAARRGARVFAFEWDPVLLQDLRASAPRNSLSGKDHCCHRVPVCIFRQRCRLPPPASQRHERRCELHLAALNTCNDPPPPAPPNQASFASATLPSRSKRKLSCICSPPTSPLLTLTPATDIALRATCTSSHSRRSPLSPRAAVRL